MIQSQGSFELKIKWIERDWSEGTKLCVSAIFSLLFKRVEFPLWRKSVIDFSSDVLREVFSLTSLPFSKT